MEPFGERTIDSGLAKRRSHEIVTVDASVTSRWTACRFDQTLHECRNLRFQSRPFDNRLPAHDRRPHCRQPPLASISGLKCGRSHSWRHQRGGRFQEHQISRSRVQAAADGQNLHCTLVSHDDCSCHPWMKGAVIGEGSGGLKRELELSAGRDRSRVPSEHVRCRGVRIPIGIHPCHRRARSNVESWRRESSVGKEFSALRNDDR
jgi:hypothetical protein